MYGWVGEEQGFEMGARLEMLVSGEREREREREWEGERKRERGRGRQEKHQGASSDAYFKKMHVHAYVLVVGGKHSTHSCKRILNVDRHVFARR